MGMQLPASMIDEATKKKYKRSEKEYAARRDLEIKIGGKNFQIDIRVMTNPNAKIKWDYLINIFKDPKIDFITDTDSELINRYCLIYAAYIDKIEMLENMKEKFEGTPFKGMNEMETMILKFSDHLSKLEDRMYLSPAAKVKGASKVQTELEKSDPLQKGGFNDI